MGGQGLALDGLVHQGQAGQLLHRLLHPGAPAQQPGQQTAGVDRCAPLLRPLLVDRVPRVVEQRPHQASGVYSVHQDGLPKAQHRHAGIAIPALLIAAFRMKSRGTGIPLGNTENTVGGQIPKLIVGPPQKVKAVFRLPGKAAASKVHVKNLLFSLIVALRACKYF